MGKSDAPEFLSGTVQGRRRKQNFLSSFFIYLRKMPLQFMKNSVK
jgi:hypothetical protein